MAQTVPLGRILSDLRAPPVIDFLSLDVEGFEERVLAGHDFKRHHFLTIAVERPSAVLRAVLLDNGYEHILDHGKYGDQFWILSNRSRLGQAWRGNLRAGFKHSSLDEGDVDGRDLAERTQASYRRWLAVIRSRNWSSDFHELRERSLLQYVIAKSTEGEPESVTEAMDVFWDTYFNGEGTAQWKLRVKALDDAISAKTPRTAMEIGTYCGYTAVRMGRHVPPGGKLISVEMDPLYAAIATKIIEHAGLRDRVFVEIGTVKDRLAAIQKKYSLSGSLDAVLLDHDVNSYLPDLKRLEAEGLITKGTVVLCDWSLYPGSDDYGRPLQVPTDGKEFMTYLAQAGRPTATHTLTGKEVFTVSSWTGVV